MSNLLRTIQQVTRDYVDSISHRLPSIKNGTVTAVSSDGTATVRVDGDAATTASVPSIAAVKPGDRVKMVLSNRQLTILGAIQRSDKLDADTIEKSSLLDMLYPVGSIYIDMGADLTTCPIQKTLGGTWAREAGGRVLVGLAGDQPEFNTIGKTGGAKTHTLTTAQMPTHEHRIYNYHADAPANDGHSYVLASAAVAITSNGYSNIKTTQSGSGQAHNNLQPYITANIWRRTA